MLRAKGLCLVANALRLPVEVEVNVTAGRAAAELTDPVHA